MRLATLLLAATATPALAAQAPAAPASAAPAPAQFALQQSHTTASLRGIHSLGNGTAWASGSAGTILRTLDGGLLWQPCTVPPDAANLDFRGVQAFSATSAVIMSSGKGPLSRIYKTADGCQTWKLVFTNPDADGFFDAIRKVTDRQIYLLGDPVQGKFAIFYSPDAGDRWFIADDPGLDADSKDGAFAAGNSSLISLGTTLFFGTGGAASAHVYSTAARCAPGSAPGASCPIAWSKTDAPLASGTPASGIFALAGRTTLALSGKPSQTLVAVGGTYDKPDDSSASAAFSIDSGQTWRRPATTPHGYRSGVAFDLPSQTWIAVGPNGCDISRDDGKHWLPLDPGALDAPASDTGWNAISLPFVVGAKGKIGKLSAPLPQRGTP